MINDREVTFANERAAIEASLAATGQEHSSSASNAQQLPTADTFTTSAEAGGTEPTSLEPMSAKQCETLLKFRESTVLKDIACTVV